MDDIWFEVKLLAQLHRCFGEEDEPAVVVVEIDAVLIVEADARNNFV